MGNGELDPGLFPVFTRSPVCAARDETIDLSSAMTLGVDRMTVLRSSSMVPPGTRKGHRLRDGRDAPSGIGNRVVSGVEIGGSCSYSLSGGIVFVVADIAHRLPRHGQEELLPADLAGISGMNCGTRTANDARDALPGLAERR